MAARLLKLILDEVDSTQTRLKRELENDSTLLNLSSVQALTQSGGRGRQGSSWQSPEGNFYISILLRGPHVNLTWVPLWVSVSLRRAVEKSFALDHPVYLKWPNDLVALPFSKLAGILCEKVGDHIIAGIGLNVRVTPAIKGKETTSIRKLMQQNVDNSALIRLKEAFFQELLSALSVDDLKNEFERNSLINDGDEIEWTDVATEKKSSGIARGLGEHGELIVEVEGKTERLFSEEVTSVRFNQK